ncbi:STAS domain-containing protein [Planococcus versutus]|uniref:Anti-anti-sigma factor n=1 Tax=Planococcus versutus TaxID=1302659 RepID=A0A1B1RX62_9BACL|nr:STAS domain-containing protein [Planococcus versutus]ANU25519.1 anti-anti-sigma factor [Planococcus versutus]
MLKDQGLHTYLCNNAERLTEEWYESVNKTRKGMYSSTDPAVIQRFKSQNLAFHKQFCVIFEPGKEDVSEEFQQFIQSLAVDEGHQQTPIEEIIEEFFRTQKQYAGLIEEYVFECVEDVTMQQLNAWNQGVVDSIHSIILEFTKQYSEAATRRLYAQQEMIVEMSAPVISLTHNIGFLPLVGEISTYRAQTIFEKALAQSIEKQLKKLFIDLSGVPIIDTMVAHQIFQVISGLKIIGVETALSGISPQIAQTAIQLGLNFSDIKVYSTLKQAMQTETLSLS